MHAHLVDAEQTLLLLLLLLLLGRRFVEVERGERERARLAQRHTRSNGQQQLVAAVVVDVVAGRDLHAHVVEVVREHR